MKNQLDMQTVQVAVAPDVQVGGYLSITDQANGIVLFAHGSGSSRYSPRNQFVAHVLNNAGLASLLIDLLTPEEETVDEQTRHLRFDIGLLATRLMGAVDWLVRQPETRPLNIGLFGASTGAAAALVAAAERPSFVSAVVSRGGRPDLAGDSLLSVRAPTLLIVGELDAPVITMNEEALERLDVTKHLAIVPGATHLFEERGALEHVAKLTRNWFLHYLTDGELTAETAADAHAQD